MRCGDQSQVSGHDSGWWQDSLHIPLSEGEVCTVEILDLNVAAQILVTTDKMSLQLHCDEEGLLD